MVMSLEHTVPSFLMISTKNPKKAYYEHKDSIVKQTKNRCHTIRPLFNVFAYSVGAIHCACINNTKVF